MGKSDGNGEKEYFADYKGEGPVLEAVSVEKTKAPKDKSSALYSDDCELWRRKMRKNYSS